MRKIEERDPGKLVPRPLMAAALVVSGLVLFAAAAASRAETAPDNVSKPPSPASGKVTAIKDGISRTITSYGKDVQDAYYRELVNDPKIEGDITVSFTVLPGGDVTDVKVDKSSLSWPPLEEEILNRIKAWKFPPFDGEPIPATVPYKFSPN